MHDAVCSKGHSFGFTTKLPENCPVCKAGVGCKGVTQAVERKVKK